MTNPVPTAHAFEVLRRMIRAGELRRRAAGSWFVPGEEDRPIQPSVVEALQRRGLAVTFGRRPVIARPSALVMAIRREL